MRASPCHAVMKVALRHVSLNRQGMVCSLQRLAAREQSMMGGGTAVVDFLDAADEPDGSAEGTEMQRQKVREPV